MVNANATRIFCCVQHHIQNFQKLKEKVDLYNITNDCFPKGIPSSLRQKYLRFLMSNNDSIPGNIHCNDEEVIHDDSASQILLALWTTMMTITICGNSLLIAAILKSKSLRQTITNLLVLSLAFSDLCVALFILPFKLNRAYYDMKFTLGIDWCRFYITADNIFFTISITNLFVISLDRYIALIYPYKYPNLVVKTWYKRTIVMVWLYGFFWGSITNLNWISTPSSMVHVDDNVCVINANKYYVVSVFLIVFFIPVLIMGFIYIRMIFLARKHALAIKAVSKTYLNELSSPKIEHIALKEPQKNLTSERNNLCTGLHLKVPTCHSPLMALRSKQAGDSLGRSGSITSHTRTHSPMQEYRKSIFRASKTVVVIYGTFLIAWSPVCVISLLISIWPECLAAKQQSYWHFHIFIEVFPFLSSMFNPFIYGIMNRKYRNAIRSILESYHLLKTKQIQKNHSHSPSLYVSTTL
eukprot:TCONS_00032467-protein